MEDFLPFYYKSHDWLSKQLAHSRNETELYMNVDPDHIHVYVLVCILKCFYVLFCCRKVLKESSAFTTSIPTFIYLLQPLLQEGRIDTCALLSGWWILVLLSAYHATEKITVMIILAFVMGFRVGEGAVDIFILYGSWKMVKEGNSHLPQGSKGRKIVIRWISLMLLVVMLFNYTDYLNEFFALSIITMIMVYISRTYFPEFQRPFLEIVLAMIAGTIARENS